MSLLREIQLIWKAQQQPLSAAFERIVEAIGLYDHYVDVQGGQFIESEQLAQHAVQSIVWGTFGRSTNPWTHADIDTLMSQAARNWPV